MSDPTTRTHPSENQAAPAAGPPSRTAFLLGLGGLMPFVLLSGLLVYGGTETIAFATVVLALAAYSAAILSFLGGIRWGAALRPVPRQRTQLAFSVLPSLAAWVLVLVPAPFVFAGFALCFALQGAWDIVAARRRRLPAWFGTLRIGLTLVVVICHVAVFVRTF